MRMLAAGGIALAMVAMLGGCSHMADSSAEDAWLRRAYADGTLDTESIALPAAKGRIARRGDDLILTLANGKTLVLHSDVKGCHDGYEHCDGYRLIADLPSRHFYLVDESYYEGGDTRLIDDRTGRVTTIASIPVFSPDGARFLVRNEDVTGETEGDNLEIWRRDGDGAKREWSANLDAANTGVPQTFGVYHIEVVSWTGDRIALSITSDDSGAKPAKSWHGSLLRDGRGWHLDARRR